MPLPMSTDRNGAQRIVYFLMITSGREIHLLVFRRTCQVNLSLQFLLNKPKNFGLKLNNSTGKKQKRRGKTPLTWRQQERCLQMDTRQGEERKGKSIKVPS